MTDCARKPHDDEYADAQGRAVDGADHAAGSSRTATTAAIAGVAEVTPVTSAQAAAWSPLGPIGLRPEADLDWLPAGAGPGRVVAVHGPSAEVTWSPDGRKPLRTTLFELRRDLPLRPVTGDWVAVADDALIDVGPRATTLTRPDPNGRDRQVLAANVDLVLIVLPIDRGPNLTAVERLSVMAWDSGAAPLIVLTKRDKSADPAGAQDEVATAVPGIEVIATSAVDGTGICELRDRLAPGVTATMLGHSGAGKTSLLNALEGRTEAVYDVRRDGQGRHTTTTRRLYPLAGGGVLLDLPGLRRLDLLASAEAVDTTFDDIAALALNCRFRDCAHAGDAGCAVQSAVDGGRLSARRLHTWRRVQRELAHLQRRHDPKALAQERAKWTQISKAQRAHARLRGRR